MLAGGGRRRVVHGGVRWETGHCSKKLHPSALKPRRAVMMDEVRVDLNDVYMHKEKMSPNVFESFVSEHTPTQSSLAVYVCNVFRVLNFIHVLTDCICSHSKANWLYYGVGVSQIVTGL